MTLKKLLLEMKYLKKPNDHRIIKDFVKLALPSHTTTYERLFLVGFHNEQTRAPNSVYSNLIEKIISEKECQLKVSSDGAVDLYLSDKLERLAFSGPEMKAVQRWIKEWLKSDMLEFRVRSFSPQTQNDQKVIVLSVHRE